MTLSFEQLKNMMVFSAVVKAGSFAEAARQLGLSRAVVSYHVKRLEAQLAVRLLNRTTRSLSLTEVGTQFFESCQRIAEEADLAQWRLEQLRDEPQGQLRLSAPTHLGSDFIVPALSEFRRRYPKIGITFSLTDEVLDLVEQGLDLAIRGTQGQLPDSSLIATPLTELRPIICASPAYLARHGQPRTPDDLEGHQWVLYKRTSPQLLLEKGGRQWRIKMSGMVETDNAAARTAFVLAGEGLGRLPGYVVREQLARGELVELLPDYRLPVIQIYAVYPPGATQSRKLAALVAFLKGYFATRYPAI
ncbi:LysR family transcriptional regulator [Gallaecimonas kandeliae]|uniref:LysR family transcriptional regulator n=1 Tax=Gallaecimonas kandeliae TaxID=3029055 RepID=UPI002647569B|nr:LysR family transcriptional regulator [Gallaecimonas kandeliae]WKE66433.1 LysR family transcriptional regulator [Gallaecimonas kandeliae]